MSRNSSGAYTQPNGTSAVSGATIDPTAFNSLISDIGTELTNSLDRGGRGALTADLNAGGFKVTNAATPVSSSDLATKGYVDTATPVGLLPANNLSDVASVSTARTNLGLTALATAVYSTASQFRANTANVVLEPNGVWSSASPVTLTDGATITLDFSTFINAKVTLGGNRTLAISNAKNGQGGLIEVLQDGTGSRTLSYTAGSFVFASGSAPTLTTTASAKDLLAYQVLSDGKVFIGPAKAVA